MSAGPTSKYAKIILIRNGVKRLPKKNRVKKALVSNKANTRVSSLEKIFLNKLFMSSSTFYILFCLRNDMLIQINQ